MSWGLGKKPNNGLKAPDIKIREMLSWYGIRKAIIFPVLALCFIAIIIIYHTLLMRYARKNITDTGELNAVRISREVELYQISGTESLERCAYALNKLESEGASKEEMLKYLTDETDSLKNSILSDTTGLYACIDGQYLDGAGWDPGPDYDPTERPWYKQAIADKGRITVINPYWDMQTGKMVVTLARNLDDETCVIAIDITLDKLQEIIGSHHAGNDNTINMVINENGLVVAHSYPSEVGRNYRTSPGALGNAVLDGMSQSDQNSFEVEFEDKNFTVYAVPMSTGWYCISVSDSDEKDRSLNTLMSLSIMSILITLIIFTVIMLFSGRKEMQARHLQSLLISSADIYMSLCDLNITDNTVTEIKNVNPAIASAVRSVDHDMKEKFLQIMHNLPDSPTKQLAIDFTDLSTIDERMKDRNTDTIEYLSFGDIWVRARLIVSERTDDGKVSHVLWMLENITKEKQVRDSLIDRSERAIAASEAKSAFLSHMSHEIRTPINAVLGMNEMILRESDDSDIISYSNNIKSAGNSLLVIINDILDFSKIESGKMEIIPGDYGLTSLLNDLVNLIKVRIDAKGLKLILDISPDIPVNLFGDEVRIKQIVTNILANAAKYTEKGSVTLKVYCNRISDDPDNILITFSVKDTGIGIKKENLDQLFSEFERFDLKRNRNIEGTGLGMAITKNLLELMGSNLTVESEYGVGSEFSFTIKQGVRNWEPIGDYKAALKTISNKKEKYVPRFIASNAHILVVDDTMVNLIVFKGLLNKTCIQIDTADSGRRGIELASTIKYDMIFLDHMMPEMDGIDTLKELRSIPDCINKDTPVIILTANAITGAKEFYLKEGFNDYLTKPINSELLEEMIFHYLPGDKIDKQNDAVKEG